MKTFYISQKSIVRRNILNRSTIICDRTPAEITREQEVDMSLLRDPQEDKDRVLGDPKW